MTPTSPPAASGDPRTVVEAASRLAGYGERTALSLGEESVTFSGLDRWANRVANHLRSLGVTKGERVGLALPTSIDFVVWYLACARLGVVAVPLPLRLAEPEIVGNASAAGVVVLAYAAESADVAGRVAPQVPSLRSVLDVRDPAFDTAADSAPAVDVEPDDTFCIMFTGGSTGSPKGAIQTQGNWATCIAVVSSEWEITPEDHHLLVLPMNHVSWFPCIAHLYAGARVTLLKRWDPAVARTLTRQLRITTHNMNPTMLGDLVSLGLEQPDDYRSVRLVTVAGSPMPLEMFRAAQEIFGPRIGAIYGLTETSGPISYLSPRDARAETLKSVGRAMPTTEIAILDPEGLPTERGEIALRGPQVTAGYFNRPEGASTEFRDGWFLTGDIGTIDGGGLLYVIDRMKELIKSGGYNVYPKEVEDVLYSHPAVIEAAVFGMPDERWVESVNAAVALKAGTDASVTPEALIAYVRERLAGYKTPKSLEIMEHLPRTRLDKLDKRALKDARAAQLASGQVSM